MKVQKFAMFMTKLIVHQRVRCTPLGWWVVGIERMNQGHACTMRSNINVCILFDELLYTYI